MLSHIVIWNLLEEAEGRTKAQNAILMKSGLEALPALIPEIRHLEVGVNVITQADTGDVVMYSRFDDEAGMRRYLEHPEHKKIAAFIGRIRAARKVVDYIS